MADLDTNILFKAEQPDYAQALNKGIGYANQQEAARLQLEQARLTNAGTQIANQRADLELKGIYQTQQKTALELQELQRDSDFKKWDSVQNLPQNPTQQDISTYLSNATASGFRAQANKAIELFAQQQKSIQSNQYGQLSDLTQVLVNYANALQGMKPEEANATKEKVRNVILQQTGRDINIIYGENWDKQLRNSQYTPQQYTAKEAGYDTAEGRNPNSAQSMRLRELINSMGGSVPAGVSAFEISSNPLYKEMYDRIPTADRVAALGKVGEVSANKQQLSELYARVKDIQKETIRPAEKILAWKDKILNTPQGTQLSTLIDDLKTVGITLDDSSNMAGVEAALKQRLGVADTAIAAGRAVAGNKTVGQAVNTPPINNVPVPNQNPVTNTSGLVEYIDLKTNKVYALTPEQVEKAKTQPDRFMKYTK